MSNKNVKIGNTLVGQAQHCYIVAEIGINHNGDIELAKKLIDAAAEAGCDAVKFQKRNPKESRKRNHKRIPKEFPKGKDPKRIPKEPQRTPKNSREPQRKSYRDFPG